MKINPWNFTVTKPNRRAGIVALGLILGYLLCYFGAIVGIIWIAVHIIKKFW